MLLAWANIVFAQSKTYSEYIIKNSRNGFEFQANGKLYYNNKSQSKFVLSTFKKQTNRNEDLSSNIFIVNNQQCSESKVYFTDYKMNILKSNLFESDCDTKRLVIEKNILPKWVTSVNTVKQKINKRTTIKKEAIINNRKWYVYYDPEIKNAINPWRFFGISGLVIRAEDEKKEYVFELVNFGKHIVTDSFEFNDDYINCTFDEYAKSAIEKNNQIIIEEVSKIVVDEVALNNFKSNIPPYECLEFIEKK